MPSLEHGLTGRTIRVEHVAQKYGATPAQSAAARKMIQDRAAEVGFRMATSEQTRIYNTFDAHRRCIGRAWKGAKRR